MQLSYEHIRANLSQIQKKEAVMAATLPRITARVDADTQILLTRAAALSGMPSLNAFVVNAAVEKAREIIARDQVIKLSETDTAMLIKALDQPPVVNAKLQTAAARYDNFKPIMKTILLEKTKHDRTRFDCGVEPLNNYLKVQASQQARKDNARKYVLEDPQNESRIIGFYTLTMARLDFKNLPPRTDRKCPPGSSTEAPGKTLVCYVCHLPRPKKLGSD
jgi:uncharacterized protein (DUF1778 family)